MSTLKVNTINAQSGSIIGSTSVISSSNSISASYFVGNGALLTGVTAEWDGTHNGDATITGSLVVSGNISPGSGDTKHVVFHVPVYASQSISASLYKGDGSSLHSVTGAWNGFCATNAAVNADFSVSGSTTLGNANSDVVTIVSQITASEGIKFTNPGVTQSSEPRIVVSGNLKVIQSSASIDILSSGSATKTSLNMGDHSNPDKGGIYYYNNLNELRFRANDAEYMTVDSNGRVGIGTGDILTSPQANLHVSGNTIFGSDASGTINEHTFTGTVHISNDLRVSGTIYGANTGGSGAPDTGSVVTIASGLVVSGTTIILGDSGSSECTGTLNVWQQLTGNCPSIFTKNFTVGLADTNCTGTTKTLINNLFTASCFSMFKKDVVVIGNMTGSNVKFTGSAIFGNACSDTTTINSQLTASCGGYFAKKVGVGTAVPQAWLHISGTASTASYVDDGSDTVYVDAGERLFLITDDVPSGSADGRGFRPIFFVRGSGSAGDLLHGGVFINTTSSMNLMYGSPSGSLLNVVGDQSSSANRTEVQIAKFSDKDDPVELAFLKSRGDQFNPSVVEDGDKLGYIRFFGNNGSSDSGAEFARITAVVSGTVNATRSPGALRFGTVALASGILVDRVQVTPSGNFVPVTDNTYDLGEPNLRWANLYTADLHLRNERGDWTIVEEEEYLSIKNNKNGKRYKFVLEELED